MKKYSLNCWKPLKPFELQHSHEIWTSAICDESRKNRMDDARLNPKHRKNGQSATKARIEQSSTTIPCGSRAQVIGARSGTFL